MEHHCLAAAVVRHPAAAAGLLHRCHPAVADHRWAEEEEAPAGHPAAEARARAAPQLVVALVPVLMAAAAVAGRHRLREPPAGHHLLAEEAAERAGPREAAEPERHHHHRREPGHQLAWRLRASGPLQRP